MFRSKGFTLLELMIVLAIIGILGAIAAQSYTRYTFRSRRSDAHHMLMGVAQAQERWYAVHHRYADDMGELGYANPTLSPNGYYELLLHADGEDYVATAVPIGRQEDDACGTLSIDYAGHKLPANTDPVANANGACW